MASVPEFTPEPEPEPVKKRVTYSRARAHDMNTLYKAFGSVAVVAAAPAPSDAAAAATADDSAVAAQAGGDEQAPTTAPGSEEQQQIVRAPPVFAVPAGLDKADTEQAIRRLAQEEQLDEEFVQDAIAKVRNTKAFILCTTCDGVIFMFDFD